MCENFNKKQEVLRELKNTLLSKYGFEKEDLINYEIVKLFTKQNFDIKVRNRIFNVLGHKTGRAEFKIQEEREKQKGKSSN